jgi:serine/threonine protein kinase
MNADGTPSGPAEAGTAEPEPHGLRGLTEAIGLAHANAAPPYSDPLLGRDIGGTTIMRLIAEGGMGRVYEGLQHQPRRAVAVKVMRPGLISREAYRRFAHESEVLGRLRHPCIAQIFSAGLCDVVGAQLPYFVMEYIPDALPITQYAVQQALPADDLLRLFKKLCDAVAHGHAHGVIHRDLKPSNILVEPAGGLKIIDFGVARSVGAGPGSVTSLTEMGQLIGTAQYMSPEQFLANTDDIDVRSDVYALGVILYELLTGRPPYAIRPEQIFEAARVVREQQPVSPVKLNKQVKPDVARIAGICLQKDRTRRYGNASELAQAVAASLGGRPVPEPPSRFLREFGEFVRLRWAALWPLAFAAFVLVALPFVLPASTTPGDQLLEREIQNAAATIDWAAISRTPARIEAATLEPVPLVASEDKKAWQRIPTALSQHHAIIYSGRTGRDGGVADFKVARTGVLLLACNFSYQGNAGGDWKEKRWTKEQFQEHGWQLIDRADLGGVLVKGDGREQDVFMKPVQEGEEFRLRCNKYDPPFVIVFEAP